MAAEPKKLNVLVVYGCAESPTRKTIVNYLYSFRKYSSHNIFYHNDFFLKQRIFLDPISFDVVVFHHSVTTPWSRDRYSKKIKRYQSWLSRWPRAVKIGLFQDEYFNGDLRGVFVRKMELDQIYTVAAETEWDVLYPDVDRSRTEIKRILTGYVDDEEVPVDFENVLAAARPIDIGYRTDFTPFMLKTGSFGLKKMELAHAVLAEADNGLKLDISASRSSFLRGDQWYQFVRSCRFLIGIESGASLLDHNGEIGNALDREARQGNLDVEFLKKKYVIPNDGGVNLRAISPRHLEAVVFGTAQILVEGDYNGLLKRDVHYIPISNDLSDISKALGKAKDEGLRREMVRNAYRDLILTRKVLYSKFVNEFFESVEVLLARKREGFGSRSSLPTRGFLMMNSFKDKVTWGMARLFTMSRS